MSTEYYRPTEPVTRLEVSSTLSSSDEKKVAVWVAGRLSGILYLDSSLVPSLAMLFANENVTAAYRFAASRTATSQPTSVLRVEDSTLQDGDTLISERGEITTLKEVKKSAGTVLRWAVEEDEQG